MKAWLKIQCCSPHPYTPLKKRKECSKLPTTNNAAVSHVSLGKIEGYLGENKLSIEVYNFETSLQNDAKEKK